MKFLVLQDGFDHGTRGSSRSVPGGNTDEVHQFAAAFTGAFRQWLPLDRP